jgi:E1A/CREB-binding protein
MGASSELNHHLSPVLSQHPQQQPKDYAPFTNPVSHAQPMLPHPLSSGNWHQPNAHPLYQVSRGEAHGAGHGDSVLGLGSATLSSAGHPPQAFNRHAALAAPPALHGVQHMPVPPNRSGLDFLGTFGRPATGLPGLPVGTSNADASAAGFGMPANAFSQGRGISTSDGGIGVGVGIGGGHDDTQQRHLAMVKQQQQRLLLLRHAYKCPFQADCPITRLCASIKVLWAHISTCQDKKCAVAHCLSSRFILAHYHRST